VDTAGAQDLISKINETKVAIENGLQKYEELKTALESSEEKEAV